MTTVKISNIDWDTDGEDAGLPENLTVGLDEIGIDLEVIIGNWLSDKYGFCHNGFAYEVKSGEEG